MEVKGRILVLAAEAARYIKAGGAPIGHIEIAMSTLADMVLEDCAALVHDRLGADGHGVAKMIRAEKVNR